MSNTNLIEYATVFLAVYACGALAILGNRFRWWSNIIADLAGGVVMVGILYTVTPLDGFAAGFLTPLFAALLWWLADEHPTFVASQAASYASEQPTIEEVFEFEEVAP